jgi:hypothetical protein
MFHYFTKNKIKPDELKPKRDVSIIYDFFSPTLDLFQDNVNIFNKLFVYVKRKVVDSAFHNEKIFRQREIFGDDPALLIEKFIKKQFISENIVKYRFNKNWDPKKKKYAENPIGFNKTIIKYQLIFFLKEIYSKTLTEMTNMRDSEGLSASDKMEMNLTKIDKGIIDLSEINKDETIRRLLRQNDVPISDSEIEYYMKNQHTSDIQTNLIRSIYSQNFMSYRDQFMVPLKEFCIMELILKKRLILNAGYLNETGEWDRKDVVLPYILTGNISGKVNNRMVRNSKLLSKIEEDADYIYLVTQKYRELEELKPGCIKSLLSTFIYTKFTYVSYEEPSLTGKEIIAPEDQICHELIQFLKAI